MHFPDDRLYHADHLWAQKQDDGSWLIGITDYAQEQLGSVIFVDLPEKGASFEQGQSCASIESVKITSDAIIPVSGEIVAVNEALADSPESLNSEPYASWIFKLKPSDKAELDKLLDAAGYKAAIGE